MNVIPMLLEAGADPNADYQEGWTCLTYAIWYARYEIIDLLLTFGADVNQPSYMGTPLYLACFGSKAELSIPTSQSVELVRQLLLRGADPNNIAQQSIPFGFDMAKYIHHGLGRELLFHYSPLHIALGCKEWDIALLLLKFGADITQKNVLGETALHLMMQPLTQSLFERDASTFLDNNLVGPLQGEKYTATLERLIFKLTPKKDSCFVKNIFGQPLYIWRIYLRTNFYPS